MKFNGEFFFVALILSVIAGITHNIFTWLYIFIPLMLDNIVTISLILSPITFTFSVILPFILMYFQAKKISPETNLIPILSSTFFGTWIGQLISQIGIHTFIVYFAGSYYTGYSMIQLAFTIIWQIIVLALSSTLFVLTTAILLAYYQNRKETKLPQPPTLHFQQ